MQKLSFSKKPKTNTYSEQFNSSSGNYECMNYLPIHLEDSILMEIDRSTFNSNLVTKPLWMNVDKLPGTKVIETVRKQIKVQDYDHSFLRNKDMYNILNNYQDDQDDQDNQDDHIIERSFDVLARIDSTLVTERNPEHIYYFDNYDKNKYFIEAKSVKLFFDFLVKNKIVMSTPHLQKTLKMLVEENYLSKVDGELYLKTITQSIKISDEVDEIIDTKDLTRIVKFINEKVKDTGRYSYNYYLDELLIAAQKTIPSESKDSVFKHITPYVFERFVKMHIQDGTLKYGSDIFRSKQLIDKLIEVEIHTLDMSDCWIWRRSLSNMYKENIKRIITNCKSVKHIICSQHFCYDRDHSILSDSINNEQLREYGQAIANAPWLESIDFRNVSFDRSTFIEFLTQLHPEKILIIKIYLNHYDSICDKELSYENKMTYEFKYDLPNVKVEPYYIN